MSTHLCTLIHRCTHCGYLAEFECFCEWGFVNRAHWPCPSCGSTDTTLTEATSANARGGMSGPNFSDLPKKDLPEPRERAQICRECKRQFVPGPNHAGYV